jgi:hypothetical protein
VSGDALSSAMPYIKLTVFNGLDPILVAVFGKSEMFNFEFDVDGLIKGAEHGVRRLIKCRSRYLGR